jgi:acyl dehydratase
VNGRGEEVLKDARAEVRVGPAPAAATGAAADLPRTYGPFTYEAGLEKIRDFALALSGGVPTRLVVACPPETAPHPWQVDEAAARASPYGAVVAPPTFAAVYAMQPFAAAITDPANAIDLRRLVHGEQALRLHEVVRAGDRLTTTGGISSRVAKGKLEIVSVASRTVNQRGALVTEGTWTAVVRS